MSTVLKMAAAVLPQQRWTSEHQWKENILIIIK